MLGTKQDEETVVAVERLEDAVVHHVADVALLAQRPNDIGLNENSVFSRVE